MDRKLLALTFLPGLIWGASFLFIAEGLTILPPMGVTFARIALGFVALGLFPAARKPLRREDWPQVALLALTWFAFPLSMFPYAEQHVSSALAGLLNGGTPLFVVMVASLWTRGLPSRPVLTATLVGLVGLGLIAAPTLSQGSNELLCTLAILAAVASYGVAANLAGPLQRRNGALPVIWRALGLALVMTAPFGAPAMAQLQLRAAPVASMLALGILGTALASVVMTHVAGKVSAAAASAPIFLIPIVSVILGVLVRGESVSDAAALGGAICVLAAWLLARAKARPEMNAASVIRGAAIRPPRVSISS
ncbi:MAG TPA: DMT family transporter [Myxococcales bacterium]|nr:DMT family transporter [Myxococcales bacterium]